MAIAQAEKAAYDAKRKTKVINNNNKSINNSSTNNNPIITHPLFLYDTGANINCINDNKLLDLSPHSLTSTITTADNTSIAVNQGVFMDSPCIYTPMFDNNLISHNFLTNNNSNVLMIYNNILHIIPVTENNQQIFETIGSDNSSINIKQNENNLFFLNYKELEQIIDNNHPASSDILTTPAISTSISPDITHNIRTPILPTLSINNVFYKTVELTNIERIVQFWHEALGHPDKRTMVEIVRGGLLKNLPAELTIGAINKHFPLCTACSIANLSTRNGGQPIKPEERRVIATGAEWEIDCKRYSGSTVSPSPSVGGNHFAITAICRHTGYTITSTQASTKNILPFIRSIFIEAHLYGHTVKLIRMDAAFYTAPILDYIENQQRCRVAAPIPHEHDKGTGIIERFFRTQGENVIKSLKNFDSPSNMWAMAVQHYTDVSNLYPARCDITKSKFESFKGSKPDINLLPLLPFGAHVLAHIPIKEQTAASGKGIPAIAVGFSHDHHNGLKLYDPITKRVKIRGTFKVTNNHQIGSILRNHTIDIPCINNIASDEELHQQSDVSDIDIVESSINNVVEDVNTNTYVYINDNNIPSNVRAKYTKYKPAVGFFFYDIETSDIYHIINIVYDKNKPLTLLFEYTRYDPHSSSSSQSRGSPEYSTCSEILTASWVQWLHRIPPNASNKNIHTSSSLVANVAISHRKMLKESSEDIAGYKQAEKT